MEKFTIRIKDILQVHHNLSSMLSNTLLKLIFVYFLFQSFGCVSYEKLLNFREGPPFTDLSEEIAKVDKIKIQPKDILYITVNAIDEESLLPYTMRTPPGLGLQNPSLLGYLVNEEGTIDYPGLGTVQVAGLSIQEAKQKLQTSLSPFLQNPIVVVRIINFRISIIGEVKNPGTFTIPEERINVLEALSLAGDATPYSRRESILIYRESNGKREFGRINLYDRKIFDSPYFQLRQNDILYVEPTRSATASVRDPITEYLAWGSSALSLITVIIAISK